LFSVPGEGTTMRFTWAKGKGGEEVDGSADR